MTFKFINTEHFQNDIIKIELNRPEKRNALNAQMIQELHQAFQDIKKKKYRVLILCANGDNFSAGADLNEMRDSIEYTEQENYDQAMALSSMMSDLYHLPCPTIALVQGACYGGANGMVAACDYAIATSDAQFCFSEVKLGIIPAVISPFVINRIGINQARDLFLSARVFSSAEAEKVGLVSQTVMAEQRLEQGVQLAMSLYQNKPGALKACKKLLADLAPIKVNKKILQLTSKRIADIRVGDEAQESLKAFLDKMGKK